MSALRLKIAKVVKCFVVLSLDSPCGFLQSPTVVCNLFGVWCLLAGFTC